MPRCCTTSSSKPAAPNGLTPPTLSWAPDVTFPWRPTMLSSMTNRHRFLTPCWPWTDHPDLLYWIISLAFKAPSFYSSFCHLGSVAAALLVVHMCISWLILVVCVCSVFLHVCFLYYLCQVLSFSLFVLISILLELFLAYCMIEVARLESYVG